jgi:hypothetical protein
MNIFWREREKKTLFFDGIGTGVGTQDLVLVSQAQRINHI